MFSNIDTLWDRIRATLSTALPYQDPKEDIPEQYEAACIKYITEYLLKQRNLAQCMHVRFQKNEQTGRRWAIVYFNFPKSVSVLLPTSVPQFPRCVPQENTKCETKK